MRRVRAGLTVRRTAQVDALLVTHFHLDHCAAVPFLLAHTPFKGRVFMTHSTRAIYHMLLADFCRLNRGGGDDPLFTEADLAASMERIEVVDFHQELDLGGIKVRDVALTWHVKVLPLTCFFLCR